MAELKSENKIISVKDLLQTEELTIPNYQRPYKWTEKNVNQLIDDIINHKDKSEYRLGTLVVHKEKKNEQEILNIVDGQQRTLTLTLIAYAISQDDKKIKRILKKSEHSNHYKPVLMNLEFSNDITKRNIQNNYKVIQRRIVDFDDKVIRFFYEKCKLVKVILEDISEAFQFFDSQNARGKDLYPHDLLKAFHLREMNNSLEKEWLDIVEKWQEMEKEKLSELFEKYLFRIRNWSKGYSAKYFTKNEISVFKGVSSDIKEEYPFTKTYRITNYYIEEYNKSIHKLIQKNRFNYPFQLDQVIINGKRFFEMIFFYSEMKNKISKIDNQILNLIDNYKGNNRTGDKYIHNMFYCGLIYYIDKFGEKDLDKAINKIFIWAYSLRLKLHSVGIDSIDNYALNKKHSTVNLFKTIRESINHTEILNINLEILKEKKIKRKNIIEIIKKFEELKYYES